MHIYVDANLRLEEVEGIFWTPADIAIWNHHVRRITVGIVASPGHRNPLSSLLFKDYF